MSWTKENQRVLDSTMAFTTEEGRCARLDNVPRENNPYKPSTVQHLAWGWGWDGDDDRARHAL